jgi:uncharacterized protein (DUF58 family)
VAAIDDLALAARIVVEGLRAGTHRSPFHGFSAEFQQHRPYRAGDDLRHLDWKLLARTERLYTRQFRETTSMAVMLVLDSSASMAFPEEGVSKFSYASIVTAALAYLVVTQGDAAGLMTMRGDGTPAYIPARSGRAHLASLIAAIDRLRPGGEWRPAAAITRGAQLLRRRGVLVVLSDFYDAEEATRGALRRAATSGHDVAMLQLTSSAETDFPFRGELEFENVESGERRVVDANAAAPAYRAAVAAFLTRCRVGAQRDGIDHALLSTAEPPEHALRRYLLRRGMPAPPGSAALPAAR